MPRARVDVTHNPEWYTPEWTAFLLHGTGFLRFRFAPHRPDAHAEWQDAWDARRDELLAEWLVDPRRHGTRPWAWWAFDAPEPRRHTGGGGSTSDAKYIPGSTRVEHQRFIIARAPTPNCERVFLAESEPRPTWESESDYLQRLNLLSEVERT
jgi:hypothetical protein